MARGLPPSDETKAHGKHAQTRHLSRRSGVNGGNAKRSEPTGRSFAALLKRRRSRC
jgi:hypothetical protein